MSESLVETLRAETEQGRARNEQEAADRKAAAAAKRAANKAARGGKTKKQVAIENFVEEQFPIVVEQLTNQAKEEAQKGKPSLRWGERRTWDGERHRQPSAIELEFEKIEALRDKTAKHFTKLNFQVVPIDDLTYHPSYQVDRDEPYLPAWTERTVGLEIAWAEPQPTE